MTKVLTSITAVLILIATATSCVHEFPLKEDIVDNSTVVVEGYITNELMRHTIKISKLNSYYDTTVNSVTNAFVAVTSGDSTYYYHEKKDGIYESENNFVGVVGNVYYLHIELDNGRTVLSAESTMLPVTPPDEMTFSKTVDNNLVISHIAESFVSDNPAKYVLQLSWIDPKTSHPQYAEIYYYSLTTVDISQLFAPKLAETTFPPGTQVIERKYSIDHAYENYLRSLLAETLWSGGYFDEAHGNLHTNITTNNPSIKTAGYFSANTVYIDTLIAR
ncbi:MAG: DUF4249 domain-containing protein [Bacteroidales bacterium]|nr:DUF4249 domain-containing protein [Bacteroidales bacterium]